MNFDSPAIRRVLDAVRKDPADSAHWHHLLIACFDHKDSEAFETYQIIADAVDQLAQSQKLVTVRGQTSRVLLSARQKEAFIRISTDPLDVPALLDVGKVFLEDFSRAVDARKLFERALKLAPSDAEVVDWIRKCGESAVVRAPVAEEIEPQDVPSGTVTGRARTDVRRMMRMTSRVVPQLLGPAAAALAVDQARHVPAPVTLEVGRPGAFGPTSELLRSFDGLLDALHNEDLEALKKALLAVEKSAADPAARGMAMTMAALVFHHKGHHEDALIHYQRAIHALPEVASLHFAQASVYHELGRTEDAKNVYRSVIARFPNHDRAWSNLGAIHYELDEYPEAEACYRRALEIRPEAAALWNDFATVLMERGSHIRALQAVDELIQREPGHPEAWLKRGMILLEQDDLPGANDALHHQLEKHGTTALALATMAIVQARSGESKEALRLCKEMGGDPSVSAALSNAWLETALAFEHNDDFPQALICLKEAVSLNPEQTMAWVRMGLICRRNEAFDEAEIALEKAAQTDPVEVRAWSELGITRYKRGKYAKAAEAFDKAAALASSVADWPYNAGVAWEKAGQLESAARSYERAVDIQADHASARINLGLVYVQLGAHEKAASCLQGLVLVRPDYARAWFAIGIVYEEMKQWDESSRSLERAVQIDAGMLDAWMHLSYVYRKLGREDEAREALKRAKPTETEPAPGAA
jgi:tetratricopeptide (TPR) repeat protein